MDWLEFISNMTGHLAWPLAVVMLSLVFRKEIRDRIFNMKSLKGPGGVEASFGAEVKEVAAQAAVIEAPKVSEKSENTVESSIELGRHRLAGTAEPQRISIEELASERPAALVLDSWREVELKLRELCKQVGIEERQVRGMLKALRAKHLLDDRWLDIIMDLSSLRNKVAHVEFEPDRVSAIRYYDSSNKAMNLLDTIREQQAEFAMIGGGLESP
jgi:hypothetical protein